MIYDGIENGVRYEPLGKAIAAAFRAARAMTPETAAGRYEYDYGVFANVMSVDMSVGVPKEKAQPTGKAVFETHKRYLDLQVVLDGEETMQISSPRRLSQTAAYDEAKDVAFFVGTGAELTVRAGEFYLVYPDEAHAPSLPAGTPTVKKAVFKIPCETGAESLTANRNLEDKQ